GVTQAVEELEAIGPPPYGAYEQLTTERKWAGIFAGGNPSVAALPAPALGGPRYSIGDVVSYIRGLLASQDHFLGATLDGPMFHVDLGAIATELEGLIVLLSGLDVYS